MVDLELVLEEEEVDGEEGGEGGGLGGSSPSSFCLLKIHLESVSSAPSNHHIKPLPSPTW